MLRFSDDVALARVADGVEVSWSNGRLCHLPGAAEDVRILTRALREPQSAAEVRASLPRSATALLTRLTDFGVVVEDPTPDRLLALHHATCVAGDSRVTGHADEAHETLTRPGVGQLIRLEVASTVGSLAAALTSRRSCHRFADSPLALPVLGDLLGAATGATLLGGHRAYPSAGNLHPVGVLLVALQVEGIVAGTSLRYDPVPHTLAAGAVLPVDSWLLTLCGLASTRPAAVALLIVDLSRPSVSRYAERGYRFALLEAGHLAQNLMLVAAEAGLGSLAVGAVEEEVLRRGRVLAHDYEVVVYAVALGHPETRP